MYLYENELLNNLPQELKIKALKRGKGITRANERKNRRPPDHHKEHNLSGVIDKQDI